MARVKICGITNIKDAAAACAYGADAIGFVFAKSPRRISPTAARSIIKKLPPYITTVGVFVNEEKAKVDKTASACGLDCLQFHGDETPEYCNYYKNRYKIVKVVRIHDKDSLSGLNKYDVDAFLLDSYVPGKPGGTGIKFDWNLAVKAKKYRKPVIVAGGIDCANVKDVIRKVRPYAIDVSSAVEAAPGRKNHALMKMLIKKARAVI